MVSRYMDSLLFVTNRQKNCSLSKVISLDGDRLEISRCPVSIKLKSDTVVETQRPFGHDSENEEVMPKTMMNQFIHKVKN